MTFMSAASLVPCKKDIVTYTLSHANYKDSTKVLINASNPKESISLRQARFLVRKLIGGFSDHGVQENDTICIHLFNSILYPIFFLGILGAEGRFTGSNPAYTATELSHHFKTSKTRFVITSRAQLETVKRAAVTNNIPFSHIVVIDGSGDDKQCISLDDLSCSEERSWRTFEDACTSRSTIAALMSTSGTTGMPKMAARSHSSWVAENQAIEDRCSKPYQVRRLLCVPFFHAFAAPLALISALRSGHVTYVMSRFDHTEFLSAIDRFAITETAMPPPLIVRFLGLPSEEITALRRLELIWSGGAPLSATTQETALQIFSPTARICQVYGMTEGGWMTTFQYPERDSTGSVGRLLASFEAKIVDAERGRTLDQDSAGEVLIRGPIVMSGYLDNDQATKTAFDGNGWLRTGDVGYIGADGKLYIIDRKKELIKVRGWQVAPPELESCLLLHDEILDAAVIGIPHPWEATEVPRAYVVRRQGSILSPEDILTFLRQYLAKYKVMDCQVRFCDNIPKSASGKILKKVLREAGSDSGYESANSPEVDV